MAKKKKKKKQRREDNLRDFLGKRLKAGTFADLISNLHQVQKALETRITDFAGISADEGGPTIGQVAQNLLAQQQLATIEHLEGLRLIGTNVQVLSTGRQGFQPSMDIFASNPETGIFAIIEVKIHQGPEREVVTELSAYQAGLAQKLPGLTPIDVIWMPISTEWRTTPREAIKFHNLLRKQYTIPIQANVTWSQDRPTAVDLEILDMSQEALDEVSLFPFFLLECFDAYSFSLENEPDEPTEVLHSIATRAAQLGLSGFCFYTTSNVENHFLYPYSFFVAAYNPLKGGLRMRQLRMVKEEEGMIGLQEQLSNDNWELHDVDLRNFDDFFEVVEGMHDHDGNQLPLESLELEVSLEFHSRSSAERLSRIFGHIKRLFETSGSSVEVGAPSIRGLFEDGTFLTLHNQERFTTFGFMREVFEDRLLWEYANVSDGDGPVLGDIGGGLHSVLGSPSIFEQLLELMTLQHEYQEGLFGREDGEDEDDDDDE